MFRHCAEDRGVKREKQVMGSAMTSRERVLTALRHEQPDRTPRDFWAEPPAWKRLFAHLGHDDKDRLLDSLGVDVRHLEARRLSTVRSMPASSRTFGASDSSIS